MSLVPMVLAQLSTDPTAVLTAALAGFLVVLVVSVVIFLILREFVTWYWKLNRIVQLLESIDRRLQGSADWQRDAVKAPAYSSMPHSPETSRVP